MIGKRYTVEEHHELLIAFEKVGETLPVAINPAQLFSKEEIREIYQYLSRRMDVDSSLKDDDGWKEMWGRLAAIADYYGIVGEEI